jgi:probable phosphoglycerate mutase
MKIYAIRHGLTEFNKKGIINGHLEDNLAPEGIEQAMIVAVSLPRNIKHIYSSSLLRTKQTANLLNSVLNVPISYYDELKEVDFGSLSGQVFDEDRKKKHKSQQYDWRPERGESFEDVKKRVLKIFEKIKVESKDGEALVVTHGGIIRLMHFLEKGSILDEVANVSLQVFDLDKILK